MQLSGKIMKFFMEEILLLQKRILIDSFGNALLIFSKLKSKLTEKIIFGTMRMAEKKSQSPIGLNL